MTFKVRVCVAKGCAANPTPPYKDFKQLIEFSRTDPVNTVEELDRAGIVKELEEVCCRPTMLVTGSWGTPYECPGGQLSARTFRTYKRYDWPSMHSLWMSVEIQV